MISTNLTHVSLKSLESAELAAAMEAFERSGGAVQSLGTYGIKPKDVTWRNDGFNLSNSSQVEARELALLERVKGLIAGGIGRTSIIKSLGTNGRAKLDRLVEKYHLKINASYSAGQLSFQARNSRDLQRRKKREEVAAIIRPMVEAGATLRKMEEVTGTSRKTLARIVDEFELRMGEGK